MPTNKIPNKIIFSNEVMNLIANSMPLTVLRLIAQRAGISRLSNLIQMMTNEDITPETIAIILDYLAPRTHDTKIQSRLKNILMDRVISISGLHESLISSIDPRNKIKSSENATSIQMLRRHYRHALKFDSAFFSALTGKDLTIPEYNNDITTDNYISALSSLGKLPAMLLKVLKRSANNKTFDIEVFSNAVKHLACHDTVLMHALPLNIHSKADVKRHLSFLVDLTCKTVTLYDLSSKLKIDHYYKMILQHVIIFNPLAVIEILNDAIFEGKVELASLIIKSGLNLTASHPLKQTPLTSALFHMNFVTLYSEASEVEPARNLVKSIVSAKVNLDEPDEKGYTAAMIMAKEGKNDELHYLLREGANPKQQHPKSQRSLLHILSNSPENQNAGSWMWVPYFLACGVDINLRDRRGNTPLHYAANKENFELCQMLIDHGADNTTVNNKGLSPRDLRGYYYFENGHLKEHKHQSGPLEKETEIGFAASRAALFPRPLTQSPPDSPNSMRRYTKE